MDIGSCRLFVPSYNRLPQDTSMTQIEEGEENSKSIPLDNNTPLQPRNPLPPIFEKYIHHHEQIFKNSGMLTEEKNLIEIQESMERAHRKFHQQITDIGNDAIFKVILPLLISSNKLIRTACSGDEKFISKTLGSWGEEWWEDSVKLVIKGLSCVQKAKYQYEVYVLVIESLEDRSIIGEIAFTIPRNKQIPAEIFCLDIIKSEQRKGLGTLLLQLALLEISEKNVEEVLVTTSYVGAHLYLQTGFLPNDCKEPDVMKVWESMEDEQEQIDWIEGEEKDDLYLKINDYKAKRNNDERIITKIRNNLFGEFTKDNGFSSKENLLKL